MIEENETVLISSSLRNELDPYEEERQQSPINLSTPNPIKIILGTDKFTTRNL